MKLPHVAPLLLPILAALVLPTGARAQEPAVLAARELCVTFEPSPFGGDAEVCFDSAGKIPWRRDGAREFASSEGADEKGSVDSLGNRLTLRKGLSAFAPGSYGADTSTTELNFRSKALWHERRVNDASGEIVALAVETAPLSRLPSRLQSLGIDLAHPLSGAEQGETVTMGASTGWSRKPYAYVSNWVRTDPAPEGQDTLVQRVDHSVRLAGGGLPAAVRVMQTALANGLLRTSDNLGGSRTESYDEARLLIEARDAMGPIAQLEIDAAGAPSILYLGDRLAIRYFWGEQGWARKEVFDPATGQVLYAVDSVEASGSGADAPENLRTAPARVTQVELANFGPVVEWDDDLGGVATQVVGLAGAPYLLRPLEGTGTIWRSLTPLAHWGVDDRVDYTEGEYRLHLIVRNGTWGSAQPHRLLFEAARTEETSATAEASTTFPLKTAGCARLIVVTEYRWNATTGSLTVSTYTECIAVVPDGGGTRFNPRENRPEQQAEREEDRRLDGQKEPQLKSAILGIPAFLAKPRCRALFTFSGSRFPNNPEAIIGLGRFRNGIGISVQSPAGGSWHPCRPLPQERPQRSARAFTPGPFRSSIFLCDSFFAESTAQRSMTLIHEMLHVSGMPEDEDSSTRAVLSSLEINSLVRAACE